MPKPRRTPRSEEGWFEVPHVGYWITILPLIAFFTCSVYKPEILPLDSLGPLGDLTKYLSAEHPTLFKAGWFGMVAVHLGEGVVAYTMSRRLGYSESTNRKWALQTFIIGFSSLFLLKSKYDAVIKSK